MSALTVAVIFVTLVAAVAAVCVVVRALIEDAQRMDPESDFNARRRAALRSLPRMPSQFDRPSETAAATAWIASWRSKVASMEDRRWRKAYAEWLDYAERQVAKARVNQRADERVRDMAKSDPLAKKRA